MKEQEKQGQDAGPEKPVEFVLNDVAPARFVSIEPEKLKVSQFHSCGERRVRNVLNRRDLGPDIVAALTQRCYEFEPGARTRLRIEFVDGKERVHPAGMLELSAERGKLSKTRLELTGKEKEVVVDYLAPDETIKVSIRAFLDGFARGKIHLHLEA